MSSYIWAFIFISLVLAGNILGPDATHISDRFFDSVLHFLGGVGLAFFFLGLSSSLLPRFRTMSRIIFYVFLCALVWEVFEIHYNITGYLLWTTAYYWDTLKDVVLDVIGACIVAWFVIKKDVK